MIKIIHGDLLEAKVDIVGHQVNCMGVMGSGVAWQIRKKLPQAYHEYLTLTRSFDDKSKLLGHCQLVHIGNNKFVANLFGQLNYGYGKQHTDYNALKNALMELKCFAKVSDMSIALPFKIGSDRGGADWNKVYDIIEEIFCDYEVTLYKLEM